MIVLMGGLPLKFMISAVMAVCHQNYWRAVGARFIRVDPPRHRLVFFHSLVKAPDIAI